MPGSLDPFPVEDRHERPPGLRLPFRITRRHVLLALLLALTFMAASRDASRGGTARNAGPFERGVTALLLPLQRGAATVKSVFTLGWHNIALGFRTREKMVLLEDRVRRLEAELAKVGEKASEADRIAGLLLFKMNNPHLVTTARIVGHDTAYGRTVTIDRGSRDGIAPNMPVVASKGIVGRVVTVRSTSAQVLLLRDVNSAVDSLVQRSRAKGILYGNGDLSLELRFMERHEDVRTGDLVVTSGITGIFPPGLVLGEVIAVDKEGQGLFQVIKVRPAEEAASLEEVLVITGTRG
jgi:rod shape-determining protein MreC